MDKETIETVLPLIRRYKTIKREKTKNKIRNDLYLLLQPFILKCLKSRLSKKNMWLDEGEILSTSWDAFEYCLERYEEKYFLPSHFRIYTGFYILNHLVYRNLPNISIDTEDGKRAAEDSIDGTKLIIGEYLVLKQFYTVIGRELGEEYTSIFEDALMSMSPSCFHRRSREKELKINHYRYTEAKKIFRLIIMLFLLSGE